MITLGSKVNARNFSRMLTLCDTYSSTVTHGTVVAIYPEYADSHVVLWHTPEGPQTVAHMIAPTELETVK